MPHLGDFYDLTSYAGRVRYNAAIFSPFNLRFGSADVAAANATLTSPTASSQETHHALVVRAACAPQGELLPCYFRNCGWAPFATPFITFIVWSAVHHPTSLRHLFAGHFMIQSHLAGCTYFNRGGDGGVSTTALVRSYFAAIFTAVPLGFGAAVAAKRWALLRPFGRVAPYPGVAAANAVACICIRQDDIANGVPVYGAPEAHDSAEPAALVGSSSVAGWAAVRDTALTRLVLPVSNFLLVPAVQGMLTALRGRSLGLLVQAGVTASVFSLWAPCAMGIFPPVMAIEAEALEEELRARARELGVARVCYERGF